MFGAPALPGAGHYDPALAGTWADPTRSGSPQLAYNDSRAIIAAAQAAAAAGKPPKRLPTSAVKPSGRTRPTNNQLLYKAYFRWDHYCHKIHAGPTLPDETEACASVTSAFLQVLQTLHSAESRRVDKPRNILQILSTNTRRTKVVELSSGTHRVADELRRHCLNDGELGQYSTNLDRNRYGNDDQYLSTVIRYDLEFLDLCPCLVDVEIIDAKQGNESTLVSAGPDMCGCDGTQRKQPQAQPLMQPQQVAPVEREREREPPAPKQSWQAPAASAERGVSGRLYAPVATHPTQSRGTHASGGSDLFDALLMAATGGTETAQAPSAGEPPVTSRPHGSLGGLPRQRSRLWHTPASLGEVDSLQNALEAWKADEEIASGQHALDSPFRRVPSRRRLPRKGSYSNFNATEDSQQGAGTGGDGLVVAKERSGENGPQTSVRSQEGDTEVARRREDEVECGDDGSGPLQRGIIRSVHRQSSAVNLTNLSRLGKDAEIKRLQDECRMHKDEVKALEGALEEARTRELQAVSKADSLHMELDRSRTQGHQFLEQINLLRTELLVLRGSPQGGAGAGPGEGDRAAKRTSSDAGTTGAHDRDDASERTRSEGNHAGGAKLGDADALQRKLSLAHAAIQQLESDKRLLEAKLQRITSLALTNDAAAAATSYPQLQMQAAGPGLGMPQGAGACGFGLAAGAALLKAAAGEGGFALGGADGGVAALLHAHPLGLPLGLSSLSSQPSATHLQDSLMQSASGKRKAPSTTQQPSEGGGGCKRHLGGGAAADGGTPMHPAAQGEPLGAVRQYGGALSNGDKCAAAGDAAAMLEEAAGSSGRDVQEAAALLAGVKAEPGAAKTVSPNRSSHSSSPADAKASPPQLLAAGQGASPTLDGQ